MGMDILTDETGSNFCDGRGVIECVISMRRSWMRSKMLVAELLDSGVISVIRSVPSLSGLVRLAARTLSRDMPVPNPVIA